MEQKTKQILITTGIIGVLSLVAYKLLAKGGSDTSNLKAIEEATKTQAVDTIPPAIEDVGIYTDSEIAAKKAAEDKNAPKFTSEELADLLQQDFNGNGTNWSAGLHGGIIGILLQLNSDSDFDNLNAAYGIRPIKAGFLTGLFKKPYVGDMNGAFNSELTQKEIAAVNDLLSKKGITRRITIENAQ